MPAAKNNPDVKMEAGTIDSSMGQDTTIEPVHHEQPQQHTAEHEQQQDKTGAHGFEHQVAALAVANSDHQFIHPDLRGPSPSVSAAPTASMMPTSGSPPHSIQQAIAPPPQVMSGAPVTGSMPGPPALIAPAVTGAAQAMMHQGLVQPIPAQDTLADGRKKRELSNSKRAAQNRAAQRAFRQRKDAYIKKLEAQVGQYPDMDIRVKEMHDQVCSMRQYIELLQDSLVQHGIEIPAMPDNMSLSHTVVIAQTAPELQDAQMSEAPMDGSQPTDPSIDDAVAQAVAGLGAQEQMHQHQQEQQHSQGHHLRGQHLQQDHQGHDLEQDQEDHDTQQDQQDQHLQQGQQQEQEQEHQQPGPEEVGVNDGASYPQQFESEGP